MKNKSIKYSLDEHVKRFSTEKKCLNYLEKQRWDGRPQCPKCGNLHLNYYLSKVNRYKCSNCKYQFNVLSDTVFHSTRLKLTTWFKAIYYFVTHKRSLSSCQLAKWLGVQQKTAWFMMMRLREALYYENEDNILSGIVEVDETYVSPSAIKDTRVARKKKIHEENQNNTLGYTRSKKTKLRKQILLEEGSEEKIKQFEEEQKRLKENGKRTPFDPAIAILGMYQRNGKLVLLHVGRQYHDTTKEVITPHLFNTVDLNSVLVTDESSLYTTVGRKYSDHQVVNHMKSYVTEEGVHTNGIENVFNHFKRMIRGTYFHLSFWHFYRYLNEHSFRWNVRSQNEKEQCEDFTSKVFGKRITYQDLVLSTKTAA